MNAAAKTITYRHACGCDTANQPAGDHTEHRFDVDGEPFPWLITEAGATFRTFEPLTSLKYLCTVTVLTVDPKDVSQDLFVTLHGGRVDIGYTEFPWLIYDVVPQFTADRKLLLQISFLAEQVDTDGPIQ